MKIFVLSILSCSIFPSLYSDACKNAEQELLNKNTDAVAKLTEVRAKIQNEKIPLSTKLSGLERSVQEKRRALDRIQRLRDNKSVSLTALKKEVDGRKTEAQFVFTPPF